MYLLVVVPSDGGVEIETGIDHDTMERLFDLNADEVSMAHVELFHIDEALVVKSLERTD